METIRIVMDGSHASVLIVGLIVGMFLGMLMEDVFNVIKNGKNNIE